MIDPDGLNVWYGQKIVGYLQQNTQGQISFTYDQDWLIQGFSISCTLPLQAEDFTAQEGIAHRFFANLLPEAGAREQIVRELKIANTDFNLLRAIGGECAGALSILESQYVPSAVASYYQLNSDDLKKILLRKGQPVRWQENVHPRLSLAGAQNKCPVLVNEDGYWLPKQESPSNAILKFELTDYRHLPAYETFTTLLAQKIGLPVVDIRLQQHEGIFFAQIKRYDRLAENNGEIIRLHQEDLCQALGYGYDKKYQEEGGPGFVDCYRLVQRTSSRPLIDLPNLLNWMIFNVLAGNSDAHAKNLSLLYSPQGIRLAPFYDLICTRAIERIDYRLAMAVGTERNPSLISQKHWVELAEQCGISKKLVLKQVEAIAQKLLTTLPECRLEFNHHYHDYPALLRIEQVVKKQCARTLADLFVRHCRA